MVENVVDIETIKDISALNFGEHAGLLQSLQKLVEGAPQTASSLLPKFYRLLEGKGTSSDMLPVAAKTFASISKNLSQSQIVEVLTTLHKNDKYDFVERGTDEKYQKLFDKLKDNGEKMWQKMSLNTAIRLKAIIEYNKQKGEQ